eukprot:892851-Rhodomonas_salina.1
MAFREEGGGGRRGQGGSRGGAVGGEAEGMWRLEALLSNVKDAMVVQIPERKTGRSSRDSSFVSNEREAVLEWKDALFCSDAQVFAARYGAKYEGKHSGKTGGQSLEHDEEARRQKEALGSKPPAILSLCF